VAAAREAEEAAIESRAIARATAEASARANEAAARASQAARRASEDAAQATMAADVEHDRSHRRAAAADAAEARASDRFQVAQEASHLGSGPAHARGANEHFTADGGTAEFDTYNEFLGSTLRVVVDGEPVAAKPILGNRGFRLSSAPGKGCQVRVYYEVAGL
jgi:hypothetical protein